MEAHEVINQNIEEVGGVCQTYLVSIYNGERYRISEEKAFYIGRDPDQSDIYIAEGIVSRHHAVISKEEDFFIVDLGSKNGTYINGKKIKQNRKYCLEHYDMVAFSKFKYRFENDTLKEERKVIEEGTINFVDVFGNRKLCLETKKNKPVILYQDNMIKNNALHHVLLSMTIMEGESCSRIYYDVGDKESLDNWMKLKGILEKNDIVEMLLSIINIIEKSEQYLLNPNGFLLEPQYIFFDKTSKKVKPYLIYIPLESSKNYNERLMDLIKSLPERYLTEAGRNLLLRISKVLFDEVFNIKYLKEILSKEYEPVNQISDHQYLTRETNADKKNNKNVKRHYKTAFVSVQIVALLLMFILNGFPERLTKICLEGFIITADAGLSYIFIVKFMKREKEQ